MYCKGEKHAEQVFTRICSDLYIHMFFSFLALVVRAFIWCWSRLTWKIISTWCRFSMLGQSQRDDAQHTFQYVALTGSGNLNCLRDIRRVSEHRENFDHMCKAPARPDLYQLTSAPSFNWKLLKVKIIEILMSAIFSTIFLTLKSILWISFGNVGKKCWTPLMKKNKNIRSPQTYQRLVKSCLSCVKIDLISWAFYSWNVRLSRKISFYLHFTTSGITDVYTSRLSAEGKSFAINMARFVFCASWK